MFYFKYEDRRPILKLIFYQTLLSWIAIGSLKNGRRRMEKRNQ